MTKEKVTTYRLGTMTLNQIDNLAESTGMSKANVVQTAIDRMYQQEIKTMQTYTNIDERYGDQVQATIADYQELNSDGNFIEIHGEIRELLSDTPGDYEVVAVAQDTIANQRNNDRLLDEYSKTK